MKLPKRAMAGKAMSEGKGRSNHRKAKTRRSNTNSNRRFMELAEQTWNMERSSMEEGMKPRNWRRTEMPEVMTREGIRARIFDE